MPDASAPNSLRRVMRSVPAPVTIVTVAGAHEARGATIGSFTSVSLAPPLVSFNVEQGSQLHATLETAEHFAVHLPCHEHAPLCTHFAQPGQDGAEQLRSVAHEIDANGTPILERACAVIKCRLHDTVTAGDHVIIIGEVTDVEQRSDQAAVLYHQRAYRSLDEPALRDA